MHMDTVNGIIDGDIGHLNPTSGSSLFAMAAYRTEPTCAHYSLKDSDLENPTYQEGSQFGNWLQARGPTRPLPIALPPLTI